jgi:hypothetical protein
MTVALIGIWHGDNRLHQLNEMLTSFARSGGQGCTSKIIIEGILADWSVTERNVPYCGVGH